MDGQNDRKMYQGDWECSKCSKAITELPFEPKETGNLMCLDCFKENAPKRQGGGERKMNSGSWKCSGCGGEITELPFVPRDESNLKCKTCFVNSR